MQRSRYLGRGQIAVCMRSGIKCHASELVHDGRIPSLLVLPAWADPPQPQERPYVPNDLEGTPRFEVSPDITPTIPPVLSAEPDPTPVAPTAPVLSVEPHSYLIAALLSWTASTPADGDSIDSYSLWRSENGDSFVLYEEFDGVTLGFLDEAMSPGVPYEYYVVANSLVGGASNQSNTVEITIGELADVMLEDHDIVSFGGAGSGSQEPQLSIGLGSGSFVPLGQLWIGGGGGAPGFDPALTVDGVEVGADPLAFKQAGILYTNQWWQAGGSPVGAEWEVRATVLSGDTPGGSFGVWSPLSSDQMWTMSSILASDQLGTFRLEIRDQFTQTIQASAVITWYQDIGNPPG